MPPVDPSSSLAARYELLEELGRGGMGVVHRARERATGREVALKLMRVSGLEPEALLRFRREAELVAALRHPGIVTVHAAGEDAGVAWMACELVPGARPLDAGWAGLDRAARVRLVRDAALALGHAHRAGIVHRDVKAENLLLDAGGRVRVADFGLALAAGGDARLTATGALVGTPHAMAPEQARGAREEVGPVTDVWALGVLLYQALTGERPFQGRSLVELLRQVVSERPRPPRALDPGVPGALEAVCLRALEREPGRRPRDGLELARELEAALRGEAHSRRRARLALLLAGAGLAGLLLALAPRPSRPEPDGSPPTPLGSRPADPPPPGPRPVDEAGALLARQAEVEAGRDLHAMWTWAAAARRLGLPRPRSHLELARRAVEGGCEEPGAWQVYAAMLIDGHGAAPDAARALEVLDRWPAVADPACLRLRSRLQPPPEALEELAAALERPPLPAPASDAELEAGAAAIASALRMQPTRMERAEMERAMANRGLVLWRDERRAEGLRLLEACALGWGYLKAAERLTNELERLDDLARRRSLPWSLALARLGDPGWMYRHAASVRELGVGDPGRARDLLRQAVEHSERKPYMVRDYARMLLDGWGGPRDPAAARELLQPLAEQGDAQARVMLDGLR